jgi:hypothetical protein
MWLKYIEEGFNALQSIVKDAERVKSFIWKYNVRHVHTFRSILVKQKQKQIKWKKKFDKSEKVKDIW